MLQKLAPSTRCRILSPVFRDDGIWHDINWRQFMTSKLISGRRPRCSFFHPICTKIEKKAEIVWCCRALTAADLPGVSKKKKSSGTLMMSNSGNVTDTEE